LQFFDKLLPISDTNYKGQKFLTLSLNCRKMKDFVYLDKNLGLFSTSQKLWAWAVSPPPVFCSPLKMIAFFSKVGSI